MARPPLSSSSAPSRSTSRSSTGFRPPKPAECSGQSRSDPTAAGQVPALTWATACRREAAGASGSRPHRSSTCSSDGVSETGRRARSSSAARWASSGSRQVRTAWSESGPPWWPTRTRTRLLLGVCSQKKSRSTAAGRCWGMRRTPEDGGGQVVPHRRGVPLVDALLARPRTVVKTIGLGWFRRCCRRPGPGSVRHRTRGAESLSSTGEDSMGGPAAQLGRDPRSGAGVGVPVRTAGRTPRSR